MSRSPAALFRPFTLNGLQLANRIVMAPMTRYFSPGGTPGADVASYYRRRADNMCGLIITEGTTIQAPVANGYPKTPYFWGDALTGWLRVREEVHAAGGKIFPQLWHVGMQRIARKAKNSEVPSVGPSGLDSFGNSLSEPMSSAQIQEVIDAFGQAARQAQQLGFDGVALHGAHGYLIDQFFWEKTNRRTDQYGGSIAKRARFCCEIVKAIRHEVGPDFPIMLRISQWKSGEYTAKLAPTVASLREFLEPLAAAGVDAFDCSQRRFWEPEFGGSPLNLGGWVKVLSGKPAMTVGSVGLSGDFIASLFEKASSAVSGIDGLLDRLERDEFDLVGVGRALLVDPTWVKKIAEQRYDALLPYTPEAMATLS